MRQRSELIRRLVRKKEKRQKKGPVRNLEIEKRKSRTLDFP